MFAYIILTIAVIIYGYYLWKIMPEKKDKKAQNGDKKDESFVVDANGDSFRPRSWQSLLQINPVTIFYGYILLVIILFILWSI